MTCGEAVGRLQRLAENMRARGTPACSSYAAEVDAIRAGLEAPTAARASAGNGNVVRRRSGLPTSWEVLSPAGRVIAITYTEWEAEIVRHATGYQPPSARNAPATEEVMAMKPVRAVLDRINRRLEASNLPIGHALARSWESDLHRAICAAPAAARSSSCSSAT